MVLDTLVVGGRSHHLRLNDDIDELSQRRADVEVEMDGLMNGSCMPRALRAQSSSASFSKSEEPASGGSINLTYLVLLVFRYWIRKKRFLITVRVGRIKRNPRILYENFSFGWITP